MGSFNRNKDGGKLRGTANVVSSSQQDANPGWGPLWLTLVVQLGRSRRTVFWALGLIAGFTGLILATMPPAAGRASASPQLLVHVTISGGYKYTGTFRSFRKGIGNGDNLCILSQTKQDIVYNVLYNDMVWSTFVPTKNAFVLNIDHYRSNVRRYTREADLIVGVIVAHHAYSNTKGLIGVTVAKDGLSGHLSATRLVPVFDTHGAPVNLQADWRCASVFKFKA